MVGTAQPATPQSQASNPQQDLGPVYNEAGQAWGVAPSLLYAMGGVESNHSLTPITSSAGAQGMQQFEPSTAQSMGVTDPQDPVQSVWASAKLMSQLMKQYGGNTSEALQAYNAGSDRTKWNPDYATRVAQQQQALFAQPNGGQQPVAQAQSTQAAPNLNGTDVDPNSIDSVLGMSPTQAQAPAPNPASPQAPVAEPSGAAPGTLSGTNVNPDDIDKSLGFAPATPAQPSPPDPYLDAASGGIDPAAFLNQTKSMAAGAGKSVVGMVQDINNLEDQPVIAAAKLGDYLHQKLLGSPSNYTQTAQNMRSNNQAPLNTTQQFLTSQGGDTDAGQAGQVAGDIGIGALGGEAAEGVAGLARGLPYAGRAANALLRGGIGRGAVQGLGATTALAGPNGPSASQLGWGTAGGAVLGPLANLAGQTAGLVGRPIVKYIAQKMASAPQDMQRAAEYINGVLDDQGVTHNQLDQDVKGMGQRGLIKDHPALRPLAQGLSQVQGDPHDILAIPAAERVANLHQTDVPAMMDDALGLNGQGDTDLHELIKKTAFANNGNEGATGANYKPGLYQKAGAQTVPMPDALKAYANGDTFGVLSHLQDIAKSAQDFDTRNGKALSDQMDSSGQPVKGSAYDLYKPAPPPQATQVALSDAERLALWKQQNPQPTAGATKPITKAANAPEGPLDAAAIAKMLGQPAPEAATAASDLSGIPTHKTIMVQPQVPPQLRDDLPMQWLMDLKPRIKAMGGDAWEGSDPMKAKALVGPQHGQDGGLLQDVNNHMRAVSPDFAKANDNDARLARAKDAFDQGTNYEKMTPQEIKSYMLGDRVNGKVVGKEGLDQEGQKWFLSGLAHKKMADLQGATVNPDGTPKGNSVSRVFGNFSDKNNLTAALGNHARGEALFKKMQNAAQLMDNDRALLKAPKVAQTSGPNKLLRVGAAVAEAGLTHGASLLHSGPGLLRAGATLARHAGNYADEVTKNMSPELQKDVASLLASPHHFGTMDLLRKYAAPTFDKTVDRVWGEGSKRLGVGALSAMSHGQGGLVPYLQSGQDQ